MHAALFWGEGGGGGDARDNLTERRQDRGCQWVGGMLGMRCM
jgi:hypothetical protein